MGQNSGKEEPVKPYVKTATLLDKKQLSRRDLDVEALCSARKHHSKKPNIVVLSYKPNSESPLKNYTVPLTQGEYAPPKAVIAPHSDADDAKNSRSKPEVISQHGDADDSMPQFGLVFPGAIKVIQGLRHGQVRDQFLRYIDQVIDEEPECQYWKERCDEIVVIPLCIVIVSRDSEGRIISRDYFDATGKGKHKSVIHKDLGYRLDSEEIAWRVSWDHAITDSVMEADSQRVDPKFEYSHHVQQAKDEIKAAEKIIVLFLRSEGGDMLFGHTALMTSIRDFLLQLFS